MKKLYTLALALFGTFAFAQVELLNTNGSLESWSDAASAPEGWYIQAANLGTIVQRVTNDAQDGNISLKLQQKSGTSGNNQAAVDDLDVVPGQAYTITYWYKSGTTLNFKHWIQWRNADGIVNPAENDPFQPADPLAPATTWTKVTRTSVAPAGSTYMRFQFRNYSSSSDVLIDNVEVYQGQPTASIADNTIEGLRVYPNPLTGNTLYVSSFNSVEKNVSIYNVLGKEVLNSTTSNGAVNVAGLTAGVYIVKVTEEGKSATKKLVIR